MTPQEQKYRACTFQSIKEKGATYWILVEMLLFRGMPKGVAEMEVQNFYTYWTVRDKAGLRYMNQEDFDVQRRLYAFARKSAYWSIKDTIV